MQNAQRVGIVDLGSNTTRLIVLAYEPGRCFKLVDEISANVRLAEGMDSSLQLQPQPIYRAIETLKMFHNYCRATHVQPLIVVGTSAVREAVNQRAFLERLRRETGIELRVLSGEEEAYYGYLGVVNSTTIHDGYVVDIGGGSTEITRVEGRRFQRSCMRQVGVVRFTERYIHSDPISKQDFRDLEQGVERAFADLTWFASSPPATTLVGIGGTIRNLARIDQKRRHYPLERVHAYVLSRDALESIILQLRRTPRGQREAIPGLNRERADVILAGAVIVRQLMLQGGFTHLTVGGAGLREGLFYEHFLADTPPLLPDVRSFSVQNLAYLSGYEAVHAQHVQKLCLALFDHLQPLHRYGPWERELLASAALLHDIGVRVDYYDHHKHSAYLVLHSHLHGFTHREIALLALLVRSHRKGAVETHDYQLILDPDDPLRVARLGSLLRLAEYLERSKSQVVQELGVSIEGELVRIRARTNGDATVEIWEANRRAKLFRQAFGMDILIVDEQGNTTP